MAKYIKTEEGYKSVEEIGGIATIESVSIAQETADSKMDANNPVGTGSFSMNRKTGTTIGSRSHTEGNNTTASGKNSHAEGNQTTASGSHSHAEGSGTTASGLGSHAEGNGSSYRIYITGGANSKTYNITSANSSFVYVGSTIVYNNKSTKITQYNPETLTIETWSTLSNIDLDNARATIYSNCASGAYSHVEGCETIAGSGYQHVQGKNNIPEVSDKYAHIVGNGTSFARSNAHTLDWNGNAWFAGDVYVGSTSGTNKDAGSKKLATEEYVDIRVPAWTEADEGKVLKIVNGVPTWTNINVTSIDDGDGNVVIS